MGKAYLCGTHVQGLKIEGMYERAGGSFFFQAIFDAQFPKRAASGGLIPTPANGDPEPIPRVHCRDARMAAQRPALAFTVNLRAAAPRDSFQSQPWKKPDRSRRAICVPA